MEDKIICELCGRPYENQKDVEQRTGLCKDCESDVLYWEELQELRQTVSRDMALDAQDLTLEGQRY